MKTFFRFLTKIKSFWKLYKNYEYDGEIIDFIIDTYEKVLCCRTRTMSKPTYHLHDVLSEIDEWYYEQQREDVRRSLGSTEVLKEIGIEIRGEMILKEFIEKFVCKNTIIRLWTECESGHQMIHCGNDEVSMEWQTLKGESFQSAYLDREVIGVTDIICDTNREAVNIVIK